MILKFSLKKKKGKKKEAYLCRENGKKFIKARKIFKYSEFRNEIQLQKQKLLEPYYFKKKCAQFWKAGIPQQSLRAQKAVKKPQTLLTTATLSSH